MSGGCSSSAAVWPPSGASRRSAPAAGTDRCGWSPRSRGHLRPARRPRSVEETAVVVPGALQDDLVLAAAEVCPAVAISVVDDGTGERVYP
jgi:hypothetical protein